jgi:hypothetical protein
MKMFTTVIVMQQYIQRDLRHISQIALATTKTTTTTQQHAMWNIRCITSHRTSPETPSKFRNTKPVVVFLIAPTVLCFFLPTIFSLSLAELPAARLT